LQAANKALVRTFTTLRFVHAAQLVRWATKAMCLALYLFTNSDVPQSKWVEEDPKAY